MDQCSFLADYNILNISPLFRMTVGEEMRLFFQTKTREAELIWREGFRDSEITEDDGCAGEKFIGVRLRDNPIGWNPNPNGSNLLLAIEIPADNMIRYQWGEERQHHWITETGTREFLVPASVVNYYGPPVVEDVDRLSGLLDNIDLSGI